QAATAEAGDLNADFVAYGMVDAVTGALSSAPPVVLKLAAKRRPRRARPAARKVPAAVAG
ncbi:MAG: hypothetical protein E5V30_17740, partial [Mesorhizobium sp.]